MWDGQHSTGHPAAQAQGMGLLIELRRSSLQACTTDRLDGMSSVKQVFPSGHLFKCRVIYLMLSHKYRVPATTGQAFGK